MTCAAPAQPRHDVCGQEGMSIVLTFQSSEGDRRVSKGPYTSIRLEGEVMRERHGGPAIASHFAEGWWQVDGEDYLRVDSEGRVVVLWGDRRLRERGQRPVISPVWTGSRISTGASLRS